MILGITGPTGAGKTTLLGQIRALGGHTIDCDRFYLDCLNWVNPLSQALGKAFPEEFPALGQLDRKALGQRVFSSQEELQRLNDLVFRFLPPLVQEQIRQFPPGSLVGVDAVNLVDSGLAALCDHTVAVVAPEPLRLQRIMQRDGLSFQEARRRIEAQHPAAYYTSGCQWILENDCEKEEAFAEKAALFLKNLLKEEKTWKKRT